MSASGPFWQSKTQGSSLAFVKPMPKRDGAASGRDSSFEMAPLEPDALRATELWSRLDPASESAHEPSRVAGTQLGHFRIEEQIGRGGMGAVFRAVDTRLDRVVALKVLSPSQSNESSAIERFRNEARAAARMDHENIARVYYIGEDGGLPFIAFEFVHGVNVRDLIEQRGTLAPADAVNYALQIAAALRHTDAAGVVHRDIKPSNIIITPSGRAKLVDLGLARKRDPEASNELTVDGTTLGTFDYISPEQAKDPRNVDVRSDIYSLGCTLFHMLTGEPPYPVGTMLQKLLDHQGKEIPDAAALNPRVPPELSVIIRKMMDSDPRLRYPSADALIDDLSQIAHRFGLRPTPADGVIWSHPRAAEGWDLWKQYGGWIVTAAALLVAVFVIDRAQDVGRNSPPPPEFTVSNDRSPGDKERPSVASQERQDDDRTSVGAVRPEARTADPNEAVIGPLSGQKLLSSSPPRPGNGGQPGIKQFDPFAPIGSEDFTERQFISNSALGAAASSPDEEDDELTSPRTQNEATTRTASETVVKPSAPPAPAAVAPEPFLVIENGTERGYPTLEAACADAADNAIIQLQFNGEHEPVQHPVRIVGKRLLIRAAKEYRPLLRFGALDDALVPSRGEVQRMISISGGSLEIVNVDLKLKVDPQRNSGQWALFSLSDADHLELDGVSVTLENENHRPAAIIERLVSNRTYLEEEPTTVARIAAEDCFFRGEGEFLLDRTIEPADIRLKNVAVAMNGAMLRLEGTDGGYDLFTDMSTGHNITLEMKHVTAVLGDGLAHFDVQLNHSVPRLVVESADSVISTIAPASMIHMQGELDSQEFQSRLTWSDDTTFLQGSNPVWRISGRDRSREFDREQFDNEWMRTSRGPQSRAGEPLLRFRPGQSFAKATQRDLGLDSSLTFNPAIDGASDATDAGVDWAAKDFPRLGDGGIERDESMD